MAVQSIRSLFADVIAPRSGVIARLDVYRRLLASSFPARHISATTGIHLRNGLAGGFHDL
jgi:hypothetical protein